MSFARIIALGSFALAAFADPGQAADIKVLSTRAVMTILEKVGPDFERQSGHKLHVSSDVAINHVRRVIAGERFDLLIASPSQMDDLIKNDRIVAATRTNLVRSGIGVEVRPARRSPTSARWTRSSRRCCAQNRSAT